MLKAVFVTSATVFSLAAAVALADGKAVYDQACVACHTAGVAGAPKIRDNAAWVDRIAQGKEVLYEHVLAQPGFKGKTGFMPYKGGFSNLSDDDVKSAVDYMVGESGG